MSSWYVIYIYIYIDIDIYIWHEITQTNKLVVLCRTNDRFVWIINNRPIYQYTTGRRFHSIRGYNMRLSTVNSLLWCITDVFNICLEIDWCAGISYVGCCDIDIKKLILFLPISHLIWMCHVDIRCKKMCWVKGGGFESYFIMGSFTYQSEIRLFGCKFMRRKKTTSYLSVLYSHVYDNDC